VVRIDRHTFASWWVLSGGSLEKLAKVMGHSSVLVTNRYAHLKPDLFGAEDYELFNVELEKPAGQVVSLAAPENGTVGYAVVTRRGAESSSSVLSR